MMMTVIVMMFIALDIVALKYGVDSRDGMEREPRKFGILG
jgi:hypothetical protein